MTMKNWMLFLAVLSINFNASSCSYWAFGEDIRFSLFSSNLAGISDSDPLFYSTRYLNEYRNDAFYGPSKNIDEWYNYFGQQITKSSIDELIYGFQSEKAEKEMDKNDLMRHFKMGQHREAADYIFFARAVEKALYVDPWKEKEMDELVVRQLIDIAETNRIKSNDKYIQLRYTYQLVVMHYYLMDISKMEGYNIMVQSSPTQSVLKNWSAFYSAISKSEKDQMLYELGLVFYKDKAKSEYIYGVFPREKAGIEGALKLCKTDSEKATLLSIVAFKNPGRALDQLEEIAELDANSNLLELLLIREINKMEDWYFTNRYTGFGEGITSGCWECDAFDFIKNKNFQSDKKYLQDVLAFSKNTIENGSIINRGLWFSSVAYMNYMLEDKTETDKYLNLASTHAKSDAIRAQIAIISTLNLVKNNTKWDKKFQNELMQSMLNLENLKEDIYNYERFNSQFMLAISRKYLEENEIVLAALFESKVKGHIYERYTAWGDKGYQAFELLNQNANSAELDELFELWNKPSKTKLEEYLLSDLEPYLWRLTDLRATQYLREDNLEKALEIFETIPDSVWTIQNSDLHYYYVDELDDNPFESNLFGRDYDNDSENTYTKPEFVREIIRLKKELEANDDEKARIALLLGNAYYNMGYHGNSYYYTEYSWSSYEADDFKRDQSNYYSSTKALAYYELAEKYAPNEKYAAFCHCMQLKCKKDGYYQLEYWKDKADKDWMNFYTKYPDHAKKLRGCDEFYMYENAWQNG